MNISITVTLADMVVVMTFVLNMFLIIAGISSLRQSGKTEFGPTFMATFPILLSIVTCFLYFYR